MEKNPTYTHLFGTIRLLIFSKTSHLHVYSHLYFLLIFVLLSNYITFFKIQYGPFWPQMTSEVTLRPQLGKLFYNWLIFDWNSKQILLYLYWMLPKNPTYTFIQTYTFISFQKKFPPICLFPPILLLVFEEISHLYFYSDSSSIRNSRVFDFAKNE